MISKQEIRAKLKSYRAMFSSEQWDALSDLIQDQLIDWIDTSAYKKIGIYLESSGKREISTKKIVNQFFRTKVTLFVPKVTSDYGEMIFLPFEGFDTTIVNKWGIPEPINLLEVTKDDIEVLIIPMLGGDSNGGRIGYGKGFYDRYLADYKGISVGLCPSGCIIPEIPIDEHDIQLDIIITESEIIRIVKDDK